MSCNKLCNKCGILKYTGDFNNDRSKKDGLSTICKKCRHEYRIDPASRERHKLLERERRKRSDVKEYRRQYEQQYYSDGYGKLKRKYQGRLHGILHEEVFRDCTVVNFIGCKRELFMEWIEFQFYDDMSWDNFGSLWGIDHTIPIRNFDLSEDEEVKKCYNWINLRPYRLDKNSSKHDNVDPYSYLLQEVKAHRFLQEINDNEHSAN